MGGHRFRQTHREMTPEEREAWRQESARLNAEFDEDVREQELLQEEREALWGTDGQA